MKEIYLHFSGYEGPKQRGPAEVGLVEEGATGISFAEVGIDEIDFALQPHFLNSAIKDLEQG